MHFALDFVVAIRAFCVLCMLCLQTCCAVGVPCTHSACVDLWTDSLKPCAIADSATCKGLVRMDPRACTNVRIDRTALRRVLFAAQPWCSPAVVTSTCTHHHAIRQGTESVTQLLPCELPCEAAVSCCCCALHAWARRLESVDNTLCSCAARSELTVKAVRKQPKQLSKSYQYFLFEFSYSARRCRAWPTRLRWTQQDPLPQRKPSSSRRSSLQRKSSSKAYMLSRS